jgi:hypothetical protein
VFRPARMSAEELEHGTGVHTATSTVGIDRTWRGGARDVLAGLRHFAYAAGWKKFEPLVGPGDPCQARGNDVANARGDPERVRTKSVSG